ncbi:FAD-dependent oxidoreductase [Barrientosiimonas endolithica]|uniref:NAD(P)/FAD-dependent oxidoreductase n=1 Tax=Barrientosiimonas endolithica TaxID=1535208 RepID=A0ABM8HC24_9MICO|nr:hypothetical protein GCM10025872_21230 [Barrientosiimonas endolithica]
MPAGTERRDVVVVGGGHNALTAAAYLAQAGSSVLLLERDDHLGGATVSAEAFPGTGARLSRYSYLVSLLPQRIIDDLGLSITLRRRRFASYTPRPGSDVGLLVDNHDAGATRRSFEAIGAGGDHAGFTDLYDRTTRLAQAVWPSVTAPLPRRSELRRALGDDATWDAFVERPLGEVIERSVRDDLVRGVVLTDGLISTFARAHQADLQQNVCFLYHVIGGGTGAWDVPVGGMGQVSGALEQAARAAGATLVTGAEVTGVDGDGVVTYVEGGEQRQVRGRTCCGAALPVTSRGCAAPSRRPPRAHRSRSTCCCRACRGCARPASPPRPRSAAPSTCTSRTPSSSRRTPAPRRASSPSRCPPRSTATPSPTRASCRRGCASRARTR